MLERPPTQHRNQIEFCVCFSESGVGLMPVFNRNASMVVGERTLKSQTEIDGRGQFGHMSRQDGSSSFRRDDPRELPHIHQRRSILELERPHPRLRGLEIEPDPTVTGLDLQQRIVDGRDVAVIRMQGEEIPG